MKTKKDELLQILAVYPLAFPGEELQPIVSELLGETHVLSLATFQDDVLIGHVLFTIFTIFSGDGKTTFGLVHYPVRFGFQAEQHVLPPYRLPEEWKGAWQLMLLSAGRPLAGEQRPLPKAWTERALGLP